MKLMHQERLPATLFNYSRPLSLHFSELGDSLQVVFKNGKVGELPFFDGGSWND